MAGPGIGGQRPQMPASKRLFPHERVHRWSEDDRPRRLPGPPDAGEAIVAQAHRQFGERIGIERRDREQVGPAARNSMCSTSEPR